MLGQFVLQCTAPVERMFTGLKGLRLLGRIHGRDSKPALLQSCYKM
jgi:hypothetical protein